MKRIFILLALFAACTPSGNEKLLEQLDHTLAMSASFEESFLARVGVLRDLYDSAASEGQKYEIGQRLADEFLTYSLDSTVRYLDANLSLAGDDPGRLMETDLRLVRAYAKAGCYSDAQPLFEKYRSEDVPPELAVLYYDTGMTLYGELAVYTNNGDYWQKQGKCRDELLPLLEEGTYLWYNRYRALADKDHDTARARELSSKMVGMSSPGTHDYAESAFFYSTYLSDEDGRMEWLIRSAMSDVMSATKDYASLNELAVILYRKGDVDRAFRYLADHSMPDAIFYNGKLRPWQVATIFPAIQKAYDDASQRNRRTLSALMISSIILLVLLGAVLVILTGRQRTLRKTRVELEKSKASLEKRNSALQESNKIRQEYIALFLGSLSENIETERQYKNHVLKYLRRGNDKYLLEEIEALPPIDQDIQAFYKMFDKTFCNLYPDFVEKFNTLLMEGESVLPKGDDLLSPELRVFALIKLGITDSSRIASLLHYSANTIYNYRAKVKNKARGDRDAFESEVMAIE